MKDEYNRPMRPNGFFQQARTNQTACARVKHSATSGVYKVAHGQAQANSIDAVLEVMAKVEADNAASK